MKNVISFVVLLAVVAVFGSGCVSHQKNDVHLRAAGVRYDDDSRRTTIGSPLRIDVIVIQPQDFIEVLPPPPVYYIVPQGGTFQSPPPVYNSPRGQRYGY